MADGVGAKHQCYGESLHVTRRLQIFRIGELGERVENIRFRFGEDDESLELVN